MIGVYIPPPVASDPARYAAVLHEDWCANAIPDQSSLPETNTPRGGACFGSRTLRAGRREQDPIEMGGETGFIPGQQGFSEHLHAAAEGVCRRSDMGYSLDHPPNSSWSGRWTKRMKSYPTTDGSDGVSRPPPGRYPTVAPGGDLFWSGDGSLPSWT